MKKIFVLFLSAILLGCYDKENYDLRKMEKAKSIITELRGVWANGGFAQNSDIERFFSIVSSISNCEKKHSLIKLYLDGVTNINIKKEYPFEVEYYYSRYLIFEKGMDYLAKDIDKETFLMWLGEWFDFSKSFTEDKKWFEIVLSQYGIDKGNLSKNMYPPFKIIERYQKRSMYEKDSRYTYAAFKSALDIFEKIESMMKSSFYKKMPSVYKGLDKKSQMKFVRLYRKYMGNKPGWISQEVWQALSNMARIKAIEDMNEISNSWDNQKFNSLEVAKSCLKEILNIEVGQLQISTYRHFFKMVKDLPVLEKYMFDFSYLQPQYTMFTMGMNSINISNGDDYAMLWVEEGFDRFIQIKTMKDKYIEILKGYGIKEDDVYDDRNRSKKIIIPRDGIKKQKIKPKKAGVCSRFVPPSPYSERDYMYGDANRFLNMLNLFLSRMEYDFFKLLPSVYNSLSIERKRVFVKKYRKIKCIRPTWIPSELWNESQNGSVDM